MVSNKIYYDILKIDAATSTSLHHLYTMYVGLYWRLPDATRGSLDFKMPYKNIIQAIKEAICTQTFYPVTGYQAIQSYIKPKSHHQESLW